MYLATFDVLRAGTDVHGHSHDNLHPGLDCTCPPHRHACVPCQFRLLEAVQLLLSIRQALLCEAVRVWVGQEKLWCGIQETFRIRGTWKPNKNDSFGHNLTPKSEVISIMVNTPHSSDLDVSCKHLDRFFVSFFVLVFFFPEMYLSWLILN